MSLGPDISVVIPTCNRPETLAACLAAVLKQETSRELEVIVVNDGDHDTIQVPDDPRVRLVRGRRLGPAAARNIGIGVARAAIVSFTDDDTIPDLGWLEAAATTLEAKPELLGVEGPTEGRPYDPLYEYAPRVAVPGAYWTCNVAYRHGVLVTVEGFDERLRKGEDRELSYRILKLGPIGFCPEMRVDHPPRPLGLKDVVRRGRLIDNEWVIHRKHPALASRRWPIRWAPVVRVIRSWQRLLINEHAARGRPERVLRGLGLAGVEVSVALWMALTRWQGSR